MRSWCASARRGCIGSTATTRSCSRSSARRAPTKRGLWALPASERVPPWQWRHPDASPRRTPPSTAARKTYCREMTSCAEARFYLKQCGSRGWTATATACPARRCARLTATIRSERLELVPLEPAFLDAALAGDVRRGVAAARARACRTTGRSCATCRRSSSSACAPIRRSRPWAMRAIVLRAERRMVGTSAATTRRRRTV